MVYYFNSVTGLLFFEQVVHFFIDIYRLAGIITNKYNLDLFNDALFLFCGRKKDRFKALYWDKDGFILLYKRIEKGNLQWPRNQEEVKKLTHQELRWLLEGLSIQQPKAIKPAQTGCLI